MSFYYLFVLFCYHNVIIVTRRAKDCVLSVINADWLMYIYCVCYGRREGVFNWDERRYAVRFIPTHSSNQSILYNDDDDDGDD